MTLRAIVSDIFSAHGGELQIACGQAHIPLSELLGQLSDVHCSAEALEGELRSISVIEAHAVVWSVLHKSMAYHFEYMPADQAMQMAWRFISAFGEKASFFTTVVPPEDPRNPVSSWHFIASRHTFEAVLCCRGEHDAALFLATDED